MIDRLAASLLVFIIYILIAGSLTPYDIATGVIVASVAGWVTGRYLVRNPGKLLQPSRLLVSLLYFLKYMTVIEFKAHMDVVKRIFNMNIRPGIVKVPVT
ncbi:Na+/H+ antiporter subunit E, partial [Desulfurococcus mucosus]